MRFYLLLTLSIICFSAYGQADWKKKKEKAGIVVYTRSNDGAPMDEFKALVHLSPTRMNEVLNIILDIESYPMWIPDCMDAEVLWRNGTYHDIHYVSVKAPWPVTNRDVVYEMTATISKNGNHARVELKPRGDYISEKEGFVRLYKGSGFWDLQIVDENTVAVRYQFQGDPGGKVPAWLANSFVVNNPFQTLSNLRERLNN